MKFVSFFSKNDKFIATTINDYAHFCDTIFADVLNKSPYKKLSEENTNTLIKDVIFKNETSNKIINIKNNDDFIIIDLSKKITIVFAQHTQNLSNEQTEEYEKIVNLVYSGSGVNTWSKGFNIFP